MTRRTTWIYPASRRAAWFGLSLCTAATAVPAPRAEAQQTPPALYRTAQQTFTSNTRYVTADLFTWFTASGGQLESNWVPLEGRSAWDGGVNFWKDQVKQLMAANVDTLYVHMYGTQNRTQRQNLFGALSQLRSKGYDVPKVAPWLDDGGFASVADLSTSAGKNTFVTPYTQFFTDYYAANTDAAADSYLHQVDGKVVLNTWQTRDKCSNQGSLTRSDVETPLKTAFAASHPMFNNGVRMTSLVYIDPNINFIDEMVPQYQDTDHQVYYYPGNTNQYDGGNQPYWNNYKTATLKPGFWNQNLISPASGGKFLARNGGANYINAWNTVIADRATLKHVKIESWNEYSEGSGAFRANPTPVRDPDVTANDTWSSTNDPLEYVKDTANGARQFNDNPDRGSLILFIGLPSTLQAGQTYTATFVVRNTGDLAWTNAAGYKFGQETGKPGDTIFSASLVNVDDTQVNDTAVNSFYTYPGVFRGAPVTFQMQLTAPSVAGLYSTHWSMFQTGTGVFGDELAFNINVVPEPGTACVAALLLAGAGLRRESNRRRT
jgi:hypothetical protein